MSKSAISKQKDPTLVVSDKAFLAVRIPQFKFDQERWSTTRTENVEKIATAWQENPDLVRIFQDPKFGHMQLAMLRKDQLEALIKILRDMQNGQAAIQLEVSALFDAVGLVKEIVEAHKGALPDDLKPLSKAVSLVVNLWGKISSTILVQAPKRKVEPSPLSDEEKQMVES